MNPEFFFVRSIYDEQKVLEIMRTKKLRQLPVLDESGRVERLLLLQDLLNPPILNNPVVIMAGGKGTRLLPHTETCPKPMLEINGKPMLQIIVEQCIASGFQVFFISVNYLKEQIMDYFEDGASWGISIHYLIEDEPLGTAGSLKLLPDNLTMPFLVINGDVLTRLSPAQLLNFHTDHQAQATVCVREHEILVPFGVVKTKGLELFGFEEKPTYRYKINAGMYVLEPTLLALLKTYPICDMPDLLQAAQLSGHRVITCPIHEYWIDVGRPETLRQAHQEWNT